MHDVGKSTHKTRASTTTERVEDEEALKPRAVVRKTANLVHDGVDQLLADSVVPTGVYIEY